MELLLQVYFNLESPVYKFLAFCILKVLHFERCYNWQPRSDLCCWYGPRLYSSFWKPCPQSTQSLSRGRLCSQELLRVEEFFLKTTYLPQKSSLQPDVKQKHGILDVNGNIKISPAQPTRGMLRERGWRKTFPQGAAGTSAPVPPLGSAAVVPLGDLFCRLHQGLALFLPHL